MWLVVSTQITTDIYRDVDLLKENERDRERKREGTAVVIMRFSGIILIQLRIYQIVTRSQYHLIPHVRYRMLFIDR